MVVALLASGSVAYADELRDRALVADFWQPGALPSELRGVESVFRNELSRRGARWPAEPHVDASAPSSQRPALDAAIASYRAFRFTDAVRALDALVRALDGSGGGDLDAAQLSDVFLYRGLGRLESGDTEGAWPDVVRAARIDPSRTLDPAQISPRALSVFRRAVAEVARQPHSEVDVRAPEDAEIVVDGRVIGRSASLTLGRHWVRVEAIGYERFTGVIDLAGAREIFAPALRAVTPPSIDARLAQLRAEGARETTLVQGSLSRDGGQWRIALRVVALDTGAARGEEVPLRTTSAFEPAIHAALARLLDPPPSAPVASPAIVIGPPIAPPPRRSRAWLWGVIAGGAAAVLIVAIPLGVVYGRRSSSGVVGGSLERLP